MNKKSLVIGICVFIGIIIFIFVVLAVAKGDKEAKDNQNINEVIENNTTNETEEITNNTTNNTTEETKKFERVYVTLEEKNETKRIDEHLKIVFAGQTETYGENMYTYNALLYMDDTKVDTKIFNFITTRVIYSSNHESEFYVDKIDDVYIIVSHMEKDKDGYYIVFINTDGEILDEFNDVTLTIEDHNIMISLDAPLSENDRIYTNFKIEGKSFEVKYEKVVKS